jgi:hypothetical protein
LSWREDILQSLDAFVEVAALARIPCVDSDISTEFLAAPHRPPNRLPLGYMAVYGFWNAGTWLKIGKVGPKSNARYTSQHYSPGSAGSTLAGSLCNCLVMKALPEFRASDVGLWIRTNTCRVNILVPSSKPPELLSLLEAFLHARLQPRYER